jgi:hypothetical protein
MKAIPVLVGLASALLFGRAIPSLLCDETKKEKAEQGPPRPVELKVLDQFLGTWDEAVTTKATQQNPKETKTTGVTANEWVLGVRFLQARNRRKPGGQEFLQLWTYDPQKKTYRSWHFTSMGQAYEWTDQWDEESKTISGKSVFGSAVRKGRFIDKDTIDWTLVAKDKEGKVILDLQGKQTRRKAAPEKTKSEKVEGPPKPPELKVLDRYLGTWDTETVNKVAEWNPKEMRIAARFTNEWVLDGRFMQMKGKSSTGVESLQMRTYDPQEKRYRAWVFDSKGTAATSRGTWDEETKTLTWKGDLGDGITATNSVRFVGTDAIEWRLVARNDEGKVFMDMEGKFRRRK